MTTSTWGPKRSLLALLPAILLAPFIGYRHHATLPEPLPASAKGISEARILETARILSEDIGFRTVGTREHAEADAWMSGVIQQISERCKGREKVDCEVWRQEGNGNHRFDIMNTRLYKSYVGLTNFIVRIQGKSAATTEHAALINCHLDSQLPGPGAADDAISCGIMLDIINVLLDDDDFEPTWSVIFLFNHAEESLQDGSHLFSTQHPIAPSVRAVVNLEAAGTTGREILFQATSEQMIEAYSHVPRPFGVVFASDIFSSGILMSDTDFRQFQEYLNVTGLDMAIIGNSYMYHTRSDVIANIERGVAQHMGENALALVRHLASSSSPLPSLVGGYSKPSTTYWSHVVGPFVRYSKSTGLLMYGVTLLFSVALVSWGGQGWRAVSKGMAICAMAFIGALLGANVVAVGMEVIGKSMSWFRYEAGSVALFAPGAIVGSLVPLLVISNVPSERATIEGLIVLHSVLAFIVQLFGVGSASLMWMTALPVILGLVANDVYSAFTGKTRGKGVTLIAYAVGGFIPLTTGTLVLLPTLEVFVPLTGRMSAAAPADNLISTIITVIGSLTLPLVAPFAIRFLHQSTESKAAPRVDKKQCLKTGLLRGLVICAVSMAIFARLEVYDEMHMRRVFVLRIENITSGEHHLHMAAADGASGFPALVADVASALPAFISTDEQRDTPEAFGVENVAMNDYNGDWDPLYPFSAFLTPYKIALPAEKASDFVSYWSDKFVVEAVEDVRDAIRGLRQLKVRITHPGLIWTVIAFDAHVVSWDLDGNPPDERARHHIKEASFYGRDVWEVNMVIKSDTPDERVLFNFIGLQEGAMWPGKRRAYDAYVHSMEVGNITHADEDWTGAVYTRGGGEAGTMSLFKELDEWLDVRMKKAVDATLIGAVGGTVWI